MYKIAKNNSQCHPCNSCKQQFHWIKWHCLYFKAPSPRDSVYARRHATVTSQKLSVHCLLSTGQTASSCGLALHAHSTHKEASNKHTDSPVKPSVTTFKYSLVNRTEIFCHTYAWTKPSYFNHKTSGKHNINSSSCHKIIKLSKFKEKFTTYHKCTTLGHDILLRIKYYSIFYQQ